MTEAALVKGLQHGDEQAYRHFVGHHQDRVYNTIVGFLHTDDHADDLTQEVFIAVFKGIHQFKGEAKLSTWVYRITVSKCLEWQRKKGRKKRLGMLVSFWNKQGEERGGLPIVAHPGLALEQKEQGKALFEAINKLPEQQRVAFTLHKVEGLSHQETADIMGVSTSAIESLIFRAKKKLKSLLYSFYESGKY